MCDEIITEKRCPPKSGCGKPFPATLEYFYKDEGRGKDNLSIYCKKCKNKRTRDNYRNRQKQGIKAWPLNMQWLHRVISPLPGHRYDNLIKMMLELSLLKFKTPEASAKWLGMKPGTFEILCLRFCR